MKLIELYKKLDGWILKKLNEIYLWALDWTGLYVGTLCFLMGAEQVFYMITRGAMWFAALQFVFVLALSAPRYYWQAKDMQKLYNMVAEQFEGLFWLRALFIGWGLFLLPAMVSTKNWHGFFDTIVGMALLYVWCFRIRDREKKTFNLGLKPATEGSR